MHIANNALRGEILEELMHGFGFKTDSDIVKPSVLNEGVGVSYWTRVDTLAIDYLTGRPPKNEYIDMDNPDWHWQGKDTLTTSMSSSNSENSEVCYNNSGFDEKEKELFFNYGGETIEIKEDKIEKITLNKL